MPDVEKVILLPRYTSFAGPGTFLSAAINVREFEKVDASFWRGNEIGSLLVLTVILQQSPNLEDWTTLATFITDPDQENVQGADLTMDWLRMLVEIQGGGATPALTCWAVANFQRRNTGVSA